MDNKQKQLPEKIEKYLKNQPEQSRKYVESLTTRELNTYVDRLDLLVKKGYKIPDTLPRLSELRRMGRTLKDMEKNIDKAKEKSTDLIAAKNKEYTKGIWVDLELADENEKRKADATLRISHKIAEVRKYTGIGSINELLPPGIKISLHVLDVLERRLDKMIGYIKENPKMTPSQMAQDPRNPMVAEMHTYSLASKKNETKPTKTKNLEDLVNESLKDATQQTAGSYDEERIASFTDEYRSKMIAIIMQQVENYQFGSISQNLKGVARIKSIIRNLTDSQMDKLILRAEQGRLFAETWDFDSSGDGELNIRQSNAIETIRHFETLMD